MSSWVLELLYLGVSVGYCWLSSEFKLWIHLEAEIVRCTCWADLLRYRRTITLWHGYTDSRKTTLDWATAVRFWSQISCRRLHRKLIPLVSRWRRGEVPYSGLFSRRLYFANSQFNSCSRKVISQMEILNRASSTLIIFYDFNFRGLAVLSPNSRNRNASKITRYTVCERLELNCYYVKVTV